MILIDRRRTSSRTRQFSGAWAKGYQPDFGQQDKYAAIFLRRCLLLMILTVRVNFNFPPILLFTRGIPKLSVHLIVKLSRVALEDSSLSVSLTDRIVSVNAARNIRETNSRLFYSQMNATE